MWHMIYICIILTHIACCTRYKYIYIIYNYIKIILLCMCVCVIYYKFLGILHKYCSYLMPFSICIWISIKFYIIIGKIITIFKSVCWNIKILFLFPLILLSTSKQNVIKIVWKNDRAYCASFHYKILKTIS